MDLRVILDGEHDKMETLTGQVANTRATIGSKLYKDRLKSTLASKCHLNRLLSLLRFIPPNKIKTIYIPIVQIMGLSFTIYAMSQLYAVRIVNEFTYPRTTTELKKNAIPKMITGLHQINMMMTNLEENLEYSRNTIKQVQAITGTSKPSSNINLEDWTLDVLWCKTSSGEDWDDNKFNGDSDENGNEDDEDL
ncbi:hypothetical protein BC941DRAFT_468650 [Chlamydoabsidia padenii]|nr:hypothetical protein BC941DRAFT_468650 [Chlamydoabsidia padenii]